MIYYNAYLPANGFPDPIPFRNHFQKVTGHKTFDPVPYPYYSYIFICIQILFLQLSVFITSHDILDPLIRI